ncbi:MAG: hypothetical protein AB7T14_07490 [Candidatus Methylacidiphilaceae bacterium]
MRCWLQEEAISPVLGAGVSFSTEWGPLLAILFLLAVQTALAYRRGKVEPLPPGRSRQGRADARIPDAPSDELEPKAPQEMDRDILRVEVSPAGGESHSGGEKVFPLEEERAPLPVREVSPGSPRPMTAALRYRGYLRRLRRPIGAREALLGTEILWNPPIALREPGRAGLWEKHLW